jgi:peptidoglycan hydrolase CwlO-like protein
MKKVMFVLMCAVMLFSMVAIGYAEREDYRGGIRTRIQEAKQRIEQGIENKSLTRSEAKKLKGELDSILRKIDRMKDDGKLSQKEREKINRDLDRLDRDITREKRDDDHGRRGDDSRRR